MRLRFRRSVAAWLGGCALLLLLYLIVAGALDHRVFHFALSKSEPAAEATVPPPEELLLWFTQAPQALSVRLMAGDAVVDTGPATPGSEDGTMYGVEVGRALEVGGHTIAWRAMAADGHVVRGEIPFTVRVP